MFVLIHTFLLIDLKIPYKEDSATVYKREHGKGGGVSIGRKDSKAHNSHQNPFKCSCG